jgi:predicted patatin/cPLA2 family phospholipase
MTTRILSLDGGGTWGILEAIALAAIYPGQTAAQILSYFDIIAGTSAGAIIIGALLSDIAPIDIVSMFLDETSRDKLYVPLNEFIDISGDIGIGPRWSNSGKLNGLQTLLKDGSRPFGQLGVKPRILITSFNIDTKKARIFDSSITAETAPLAEVINASSSAPVLYFDAPQVIGNERLWDGAVSGLNNPVLLAITSAIASGKTNLAALSIGTGTVVLLPQPNNAESSPIYEVPQSLSTLDEITAMSNAMLDDPPDRASDFASVLLPNKIVRLNPIIGPTLGATGWELPVGYSLINPKDPMYAFSTLSTLDFCATTQSEINLLNGLGNIWINNLIPNWGSYSTFSAGVKAWLAL